MEKDGKNRKRWKKNAFYHSCPSKLAFYLSLNSLVFYLSRMLVEFSLTCIFQHMWEKLLTYGVPIPRKSMNLSFFAHAPVPHSKLLVEFFENLFPTRQKEWRKLWSALSKFSQKIWRWLRTLVYFHLVWLQFF